ncbi:hypothetical protein MSTE_03898 [Mycobacteroides stephanolepidis]|uniref:Uncharacterized protein n=1 Tax=[Mycobacterium] stephanolepidis TaxID=1520670 RepID=A0A1Z4F1W5_9MYCO|nr:hypothetical protein [[Mycobacterium] stephanolepidis]BAX99196.1 hypothetical protein MSTE_03898 [[Mycobacterium] stephanolepidis]
MEILKNTFFLYRRCFLQLIAIYLVGWLVRYGIVQLAVAIAVKHGLIWGNFLLPLSPLTMLLTYLGMFWVLRPYIFPGSTDGGVDAFLRTTLKILLPVFAVIVLWKLHMYDVWEFERQTSIHLTENQQIDNTAQSEVTRLLRADTTTLSIILVILLAIRRVLSLIAERLPNWMILPRLYVESAWVYILFSASAAVVFGSPRWIKERTIVVWYQEQKQAVFEHLGPIADAVTWITEHTAGTTRAILAPLSWFVIAGLAYANENTSTWGGASQALFGQRRFEQLTQATRKPLNAVKSRWQKLPKAIRSRTDEVRSSILGTFDHVKDALRLALQKGPVPIAVYIVSFAVLVLLYPTGVFFDYSVSDGIAWRVLAHLFGPHEFSWWTSREATIRLAIGTAVEPLRICLVAGTFWYCIGAPDQPISNRTATILSDDSLNSTSTPDS